MRFTKCLEKKARIIVAGFVVSILLSTNVHAGSKNGVIAYHCFDTSVPVVSPLNICYINADGSGQVQVTSGTLSFLPWWSPDGQQLAYTSIDFLNNGPPQIVVMNADGSNPGIITPPGIDAVGPAWSPDGKAIAFASSVTGNAEIWTIAPDGTNLRRVTNSSDENEKTLPVWSPSGKSIAYTQSPHGTQAQPSIWVIKVPDSSSPGQNPRQLTNGKCGPVDCINVDTKGKKINDAVDAATPAWDPNENIIFWSGVHGERGQIWIMDPDGRHRMQLTKPTPQQALYVNNDDPEWSPDGKLILFSTNRTLMPDPSGPHPVPEMWMMKADGTHQKFITSLFAIPGFPGDGAWQPVPRGKNDRDDD